VTLDFHAVEIGVHGVAGRVRPPRKHLVAPPHRRLECAATERLLAIHRGSALARAALSTTTLRRDCGRQKQSSDDDADKLFHISSVANSKGHTNLFPSSRQPVRSESSSPR